MTQSRNHEKPKARPSARRGMRRPSDIVAGWMKAVLGSLTVLAVSLLLSGCGPAALPGPAKGPVTDADVVGRWSYPGDFKKTKVEIEFTPDHHFTQVVSSAGGLSKTQRGTWGLDGAYLELGDILLNESVSGFSMAAWKAEDTRWWFTDEAGRLELMGGERSKDPDDCWPLTRLSAVAGAKP